MTLINFFICKRHVYCPQSEHQDVVSGLSRFPVYFGRTQEHFSCLYEIIWCFLEDQYLYCCKKGNQNDPFGSLITDSKDLWSELSHQQSA